MSMYDVSGLYLFIPTSSWGALNVYVYVYINICTICLMWMM